MFKPTVVGGVLFLALVLIFLVSSGVAAEKPINLKFSAFYSEATAAGPLTKEFCRRLEDASEGKVKINIYWAGALGPCPQQFDLVRGGVADLALHYPLFTASRFPLSLFIEMPFIADNGVSTTKVFQEMLKQGLVTNEFKEVKLVSALGYPPLHMFSNKELTKVEDFEGIRTWSGQGPILAQTWACVGATGVSLIWPEIYMGLERGTIDCFLTTWGSATGLKTYQVVKHPTEIGFMGGFLTTLIMNKEKWDKIPPDIQKKWNKAGEQFALDYAQILEDYELRDRKIWVEKGVTVDEFPASEKNRLAKKLLPVWQKWIDKNGEPAKKIYQTYLDVMKKEGEQVFMQLPGLYKQ
jgi:TRAP-type C4-dicarboxylate transport system substrate-binding protein